MQQRALQNLVPVLVAGATLGVDLVVAVVQIQVVANQAELLPVHRVHLQHFHEIFEGQVHHSDDVQRAHAERALSLSEERLFAEQLALVEIVQHRGGLAALVGGINFQVDLRVPADEKK